jgi:hypothetical protein
MATFNTTLQLEEPAEVVEAQVVASLSRLPKDHWMRVQPGLIVLNRRHRPSWATWVAIVGALIILFPILFLFVKRTETLTIAISPRGEDGSTAVIGGEGTEWVIAQVQTALTTAGSRPCPSCNRPMKRGMRVCPHCNSESAPWTYHEGVWWTQSESGEWQWEDVKTNAWRWYKDGTPSSPSATDMTPSRAIDPAIIQPPTVRQPELVATSELPSAADEFEKLASLRERRVLTEEEFQAAKARLLGR